MLAALAGVDPVLLDGKHHPCPKCGGKDRFRAIDPPNGVLFCNQCFKTKNGDLYAALRWLVGWNYREALAAVAERLNVEPPRRPPPASRACRPAKG
ncbi:MAG: primase-helicase zinc-binding domain-containing protein [Planctomycetia bacterium]